MQKFAYFTEGLKLIFGASILVGVPCFFIALLGSKLINNIGQYPSRSAKFQMTIALPLLAVMVFSFGILLAFFAYLSD